MTIHYFAFGSNLSTPRLLQRLPAAGVNGVGILHEHKLCFRKNDSGQSGKCDIEFTGIITDQVYGVLYYLTEAEKTELDVYETAGFGYSDKMVPITRLDGEIVEAVTYYALDIDALQQPYHWYKEHVVYGAREHSFPADYIASIEAFESIDDPDEERVKRELDIYRG